MIITYFTLPAPIEDSKKASENAIASLEETSPSDLCSICMDDGEQVWLSMPCGHGFGRQCLLTWLKNSNKCPMCRAEIESELKMITIYINFVHAIVPQCALAQQGICHLSEVDELVRLDCGHTYHRGCLSTNEDSGTAMCALCHLQKRIIPIG